MSKPKRGVLLVVDDEIELIRSPCKSLTEQGFEVRGVASPTKALEAIRDGEPDVLLSDLIMPQTDGIELLKQALVIDPNLIGVIMTGHGTVHTAVEAMKSGAFDYALKPLCLPQLLPILDRALEVRRLRLENVQLKRFVERLTLDSPRPALLAGSYDLESLLRRQVQLVLNEMKGNKVHAARALGVSRRSLYRLIEKYGLEPGSPSATSNPTNRGRRPV